MPADSNTPARPGAAPAGGDASCLACDQLTLWRAGKNAFVIHEFDMSVWVLGFHQFYRGYSLLLLKRHVRELHELSPEQEKLLYAELMLARDITIAMYRPWKLNLSCYGNSMDHLHWHLIPRYEGDPNLRRDPWANRSSFMRYEIGREEASRVIGDLKARFGDRFAKGR